MRSDELMHYGVLGMKWGQHRARKNTAKAKMYRSYAEDYDPKLAAYGAVTLGSIVYDRYR